MEIWRGLHSPKAGKLRFDQVAVVDFVGARSSGLL